MERTSECETRSCISLCSTCWRCPPALMHTYSCMYEWQHCLLVQGHHNCASTTTGKDRCQGRVRGTCLWMRKVTLQQAKGATYAKIRVLRAPPRCLPCLACFSGLFYRDSLVQGHNSCFTFISVDTKLAFLSAWSKEQSSCLVGVSHLQRGFPWRLASPNTTTRAVVAAGTIVAGRFSLCSHSSLFSAEQAGL